MKMNKKILIGGSIAAFIISAIAGVYIYTKKSIEKVAAAIDDTFDIGENNVQYEYKIQQEEINGQKVITESVYPKEEEKRTIKMPKISYSRYDVIGVDHAMQDDINELKEKVKELEQNLNRLSGNCNYSILFDDKHYNDYMKTMDAFFGDDGK